MHSLILTMIRGNSSSFFALLLGGAVALAACGKDPETTESTSQTTDPTGDNTTSTSGSTTAPTSDSTTESSTGSASATGTTGTGSTSSDTETGCSFIDCKDGGGGGAECDIWAQDCPAEEKCMPWANDGGNSWNATKCTPIDANASLIGDVCDGGGVSGIDNCELGSMCYYVDGESGMGVCVPFCIGSPEDPSCADLGDQCSISNDGVLILCRKSCDPVLQDCSGAAACLPAAGSDSFVCIVDASGESGASGDPCEFLNACDPGLFCAGADFVPGCVSTGCCTEFCDYSDPNKDDACLLKDDGASCELYFAEGEAPPGSENLGACILP